MNEKEKETINGEQKIEVPERELISFPSRERKLTVEEELKEIEKKLELFNKVKIISLKLTKPSDWIIHTDDNPYLMDRGSENIGIAFGVDVTGIKLNQEWHEDNDGRYYEYVATGMGYAKRLNRVVEDIGVCSQRDKFFGSVGGELKPIEEVDMANIRRKAITNLHSRLIKRLVGLMNITLDDLKEAGIDTSKIKKIEYKTGSKKVEKTLSKDSVDTRKKIYAMALQMAGGVEEDTKIFIKQNSIFQFEKDGKKQERFAETVEQLTSDKWVTSTYGRIKKDFEKAYPGEQLPFKEEKK